MAEDIINRVANSKLMVINLEDYYPEGPRTVFDLKTWLYEGLVLREKEFRAKVKAYNWSQHQGHYIALTCSTGAIIPAWAFMLITIELEPYSKHTILGDIEALETALYQNIINTLDYSLFQGKPTIIKGCSKKPVPTNAYLMLSSKLKNVAKSIMFGEACSSVPLFKANNR